MFEIHGCTGRRPCGMISSLSILFRVFALLFVILPVVPTAQAASAPAESIFLGDTGNIVTIVNAPTKDTIGTLSLLSTQSATAVGIPVLIAGQKASAGFVFAAEVETNGSNYISHIYRINANLSGLSYTADIVGGSAGNMTGGINSMILSADGKTLYFGWDSGISSCDAASLIVSPAPFSGPPPNSRVLGIAPDNTQLFFARPTGLPVTTADTVYFLRFPFSSSLVAAVAYDSQQNPPFNNSTPVVPVSVVGNLNTQSIYTAFSQLFDGTMVTSSNSGIVAGFPQTTTIFNSFTPVGLMPIRMVFLPKSATIYVLNQGSQDVTVSGAGNAATSTTISLPGKPVDMALDLNNSTLYSLLSSSSVQVIDTASMTIIDSEPPPAPVLNFQGFGTISSLGTIVTGVSTQFLAQLQIGDSIVATARTGDSILPVAQTQIVANVSDNATLTLQNAFSPDLPAGTIYTVLKAGSTINPNSTKSIAVAPGVSAALTISSYRMTLFSAKAAHDQIGLLGSFTANTLGFRPLKVSVNIGGFTMTFPLDKSGSDKHGFSGQVKFTVGKSAKGLAGVPRLVQFSMKIQNSFLSSFMKNSPTDANGLPIKLPITVFYAGTNYSTTLSVSFNKNDKVFTSSSEAHLTAKP